jgi:hypothetical protein
MRSLASLPDGKPIVVSWPVGAGTLIVCGALDAWRYRASDDQQFASFWRAVVTGAARRVPPALSVELDPQVAGPGARVQVRARVRRTEFEQEATAMRVPAIAGTAQSDSGSTPALVRFWPTGEPGVFTGEFVPSEPRRYAVLVNSGHAQAAAVLLPGSDRSRFGGDEEAALVAEASGGVVTTADQLTPLVNHLRRHPRDDRAATVFPTRNPWWIAPFTMALCAEWMLRRRPGRR